MKKIFGQSWKTTLIGYVQFISITGYELFIKANKAHWGFILTAFGFALMGKVAADSHQVKEVKKEVEEIKIDKALKN